jgi:predicted nucleic acid-binding protein
VITLDTSGILSLLDAADPAHERCTAVLEEDRGPYVVPVALLGEACYMIARDLGTRPVLAFLADTDADLFSLDCGEGDLARICELVERYDDLELGFADAAVAACAERTSGRVLTLDRRDFDVVGRELGLDVLPQLPT